MAGLHLSFEIARLRTNHTFRFNVNQCHLGRAILQLKLLFGFELIGTLRHVQHFNGFGVLQFG